MKKNCLEVFRPTRNAVFLLQHLNAYLSPFRAQVIVNSLDAGPLLKLGMISFFRHASH